MTATYARLRLEEEIRIVLDVRSEIISDHGIAAEERRLLLRSSLEQLRSITHAVKLLAKAENGNTDGHSTLSPAVTTKLRSLGIIV